MVAEDDFAEERPVALLVVAAEEPAEIGLEAVGFDVLAGEDVLIAVDRGEGLHLDQLWLDGAVRGADQTEVDGHEVGLRVLVGDAILRWDGLR